MDKFENFLLHVPFIGLLLMLTIMGSRTKIEREVTYKEIKTPLIIQAISIALLTILAVLLN